MESAEHFIKCTNLFSPLDFKQVLKDENSPVDTMDVVSIYCLIWCPVNPVGAVVVRGQKVFILYIYIYIGTWNHE